MLLNGALWAPALARVLDQSLRYTVDKTTREILFLPLPGDIKLKAKSFVDVTVDRAAKALGALLLLVLVQPWGFTCHWQQLSYASLIVTGLWILMAVRARRGYLSAFRQSIEQRDMQPSEMRLNVADLIDDRNARAGARASGSEARRLCDRRARVARQAQPGDAAAALSRVTGRAGARALGARRGHAATSPSNGCRTSAGMLGDHDAGVRAAAIGALASISQEDAASLARPLLADPDPRIRATAAVALAGSSHPEDVDRAEAALLELASGADDSTQAARRDVALAIRQIADPRFRRLLIPLLYDPAPEVADEAMESVHAASKDDFIFVRRWSRCSEIAGSKAALVPPSSSLRRTVGGLAGVLSPRSRRGHLGAPPYSGHPGADPVAEDRGRPGRRRWKNATASSATRSCRRSNGCGASIPSSP